MTAWLYINVDLGGGWTKAESAIARQAVLGRVSMRAARQIILAMRSEPAR